MTSVYLNHLKYVKISVRSEAETISLAYFVKKTNTKSTNQRALFRPGLDVARDAVPALVPMGRCDKLRSVATLRPRALGVFLVFLMSYVLKVGFCMFFLGYGPMNGMIFIDFLYKLPMFSLGMTG